MFDRNHGGTGMGCGSADRTRLTLNQCAGQKAGLFMQENIVFLVIVGLCFCVGLIGGLEFQLCLLYFGILCGNTGFDRLQILFVIIELFI